LALVERNHPNLWAARARLAFSHATLDEAKWAPYSQWYSELQGGVVPSSLYQGKPPGGWEPIVNLDVRGGVPLYTFGKITNARKAAESNVRVSEWDMEKVRQQTRHDVRRAYFGLMLARDARYLLSEIRDRLRSAKDGIKKRLDRSEAGIAEWDVLRLEGYEEELARRWAQIDKGEAEALAALRFLTGVASEFEIPDVPLKRPDVPVMAAAQYLQAARLFRPDTNMARAGIEARKYFAQWKRSEFFPDIALGLNIAYRQDPIIDAVKLPNFQGGGFLVARWGLDLLPRQARLSMAESQWEETRALERLSLGGVAVEVESTYAAVLEAKAREESWDRAEHKAKKWIAMVQDSIELGTVDERSLHEPLRLYADARSNHLIALMDFNVALSLLAMQTGWDSAAPHGT
jgi:outer membrane protein TolC